jgi:nucleotide-binding universal stress UspA family protein
MTEVIVGFEGSDGSRAALAFGESLAATQDARLVVACVHPPQPRTSAIGAAGFDREVRAGAQRTAESARDLLERPDEAEFLAVMGISAADGLAALAVERGAGAIVVGPDRRRALERLVDGSVAGRLVQAAPCDVAVAHDGHARARRRLVSLGAAFDGSQASESAVHVAERLAARFRGSLSVVAVATSDADAAALSSSLDDVVLAAPVVAHPRADLRRGDPVDELVRVSADLDLLVCGARGLGAARRLGLGSVSSELVARSHCPLLVARRPVRPR